MKKSEKLAYIAGLVDGEGLISINGGKGGFSKFVNIYNSDRQMLEFVQETMGFGFIKEKPVDPDNPQKIKVCPSWEVYRHTERYEFLRAILPYLITKRDRAEYMLEFTASRMENPRSPYTRRELELIVGICEANQRQQPQETKCLKRVKARLKEFDS